MNEKIEPALSPEEWARLAIESRDAWVQDGDLWLDSDCGGEPYAEPWPTNRRLGIGALALLGYFTWEDVDRLSLAVPGEAGYHEVEWTEEEIAAAVRVIDKLAALLPPRETTQP